jgi:outer membrane protein assembly factor BamB
MKSSQTIIGVGGHVVAIEVASGTELWRTKLKGSDIVTIDHVGDRILAGAGGELFCLEENSGEILWRNKLKGLGLGLVAFGSGGETVGAARIIEQRRAVAAATAASS